MARASAWDHELGGRAVCARWAKWRSLRQDRAAQQMPAE
jgi:hypothetical protein